MKITGLALSKIYKITIVIFTCSFLFIFLVFEGVGYTKALMESIDYVELPNGTILAPKAIFSKKIILYDASKHKILELSPIELYWDDDKVIGITNISGRETYFVYNKKYNNVEYVDNIINIKSISNDERILIHRNIKTFYDLVENKNYKRHWYQWYF